MRKMDGGYAPRKWGQHFLSQTTLAQLGDASVRQLEEYGVVCPLVLRKGLFTTLARDNIGHNTTAIPPSCPTLSQLDEWIGSFLSGRKQRFRVNGATSDWYEVTCGVPQGTKVGPVVFLAMVNSVAELQPNRWKFVDDITVASRRKPTASNNQAL